MVQVQAWVDWSVLAEVSLPYSPAAQQITSLYLNLNECTNQRTIRTRYASTAKKTHFASFSKRDLLNMLKKNLLWFQVLSREEKCFHARPSPAHSDSSSQPIKIKSFTTHYQHLPSAFPLCNQALYVSFRSLSQRRPGENFSIIAEEKVPSPLGNGQFSKTIFLTHSVEIFHRHSTGRFSKNLVLSPYCSLAPMYNFRCRWWMK
jgi:hypothetical protein